MGLIAHFIPEKAANYPKSYSVFYFVELKE